MPRSLPRTESREIKPPTGGTIHNDYYGTNSPVFSNEILGEATDILYQSEGHPVNRATGKRESGGPFHVAHSKVLMDPGKIENARSRTFPSNEFSGPVMPNTFQLFSVPIAEHFGRELSPTPPSLDAKGATAISQCAPTNPTANLASTLAESFREGVPTLPGIKLWKERTQALKALGSEYLNYQFGWAPLAKEVSSVVNAARHHRDIMQNYEHNEGTNVHREFDFSDETQVWSEDIGDRFLVGTGVPLQFFNQPARCKIIVEKQVRTYFKGCFTYGGPSKADNFQRALGFGKEADAVYGLALTPNVLWDLTPWSWAVDWFSNAGDVINNVTNFALAGLVMRYGYMMQSTSYRMYCSWDHIPILHGSYKKETDSLYDTTETNEGGGGVFGFENIEKSRVPANPFGFGVEWEGLSPTQLAITAAIGITRLL